MKLSTWIHQVLRGPRHRRKRPLQICLRPLRTKESSSLATEEVSGSRQGGAPFDIGEAAAEAGSDEAGNGIGTLFIRTNHRRRVRPSDRRACRFASVPPGDAMATPVANTGGTPPIDWATRSMSSRRSGRPAACRARCTQFGQVGNTRSEECRASGQRESARASSSRQYRTRRVMGWTRRNGTADGGLSAPSLVPFAPRPDRRCAMIAAGRLVDNEQFFRLLGAPYRSVWRTSSRRWIEGFAGAADRCVMVERSAEVSRFFNGCSAIAGGGRCFNLAARLRRSGRPPRPRSSISSAPTARPNASTRWQHDENPENLAGSTFLPPRQEWPGEALNALQETILTPPPADRG